VINDFQVSYSYIPGVPLELAISRRISIRDFPATEGYSVPEVSSDVLSKVLWAGYGVSSEGRTASRICGNYPLVIYVSNKTAVYRYDPGQRALELLRYGDYRGIDKGYFDYYPAPVELFICLNLSKYADVYLGAMEAGTVIQNIYLQANALGLGTVCVGGMNRTLFHEVLSLPANEVVLYNMPLGYPTSWAFYNFTCTVPIGSAELPVVRQSSVFLDSTLANARESHSYSEVPLTPQEISQILWSAYGLSYLRDMRPSFWSFNTQHRTIASAGGAYPLEVWFMNSTGTYLYNPWDHYVYAMSFGDKRTGLAQSTAASWIGSSPMALVVVLNITQMQERGGGQLDWAYTEIGSVIQNVFLESTAWGLVTDWSKILDENATKTILGIAEYADLRPIMAITVGHPLVRGDINDDGVVDIFDAIMLSAAWNSVPGSPAWNAKADINNDNIVDIFDAIILAKDFGKKV
jgi:nitroreductase